MEGGGRWIMDGWAWASKNDGLKIKKKFRIFLIFLEEKSKFKVFGSNFSKIKKKSNYPLSLYYITCCDCFIKTQIYLK